jgi:hypothetical protein
MFGAGVSSIAKISPSRIAAVAANCSTASAAVGVLRGRILQVAGTVRRSRPA